MISLGESDSFKSVLYTLICATVSHNSWTVLSKSVRIVADFSRAIIKAFRLSVNSFRRSVVACFVSCFGAVGVSNVLIAFLMSVAVRLVVVVWFVFILFPSFDIIFLWAKNALALLYQKLSFFTIFIFDKLFYFCLCNLYKKSIFFV